MKQATHTAWVYAQLKKGRKITARIALDGCGCFRLSSIIHRFREAGINIRTNIVNNGGSRYAEYYLAKGKK